MKSVLWLARVSKHQFHLQNVEQLIFSCVVVAGKAGHRWRHEDGRTPSASSAETSAFPLSHPKKRAPELGVIVTL